MHVSELDKSTWWNEPDLWCQHGGAGLAGRSMGALAKVVLSDNGTSLPPDAKYLALAAGQSFEEFEMASTLGINERNITLLDRGFDPTVLVRIRREHPQTAIREVGIFTYLEDPPDTSFSLVTAFGIEHVVSDENRMRALITGLPRVLSPGGVVCIAHGNTQPNIARLWRTQGFVQLFMDVVDDSIHQFSGCTGKIR